jgi:ribosomal protein S18 acetylase RimI-like enzyme
MTATGRVTNLFLPEPEVQVLMERGEMEALTRDGALFLIRDQGDFRRLYFAAETPERLAALELPAGEFITDVVGRVEDIAPVSATLAKAGFASYKEFQRMSRGPQPAPAAAAGSVLATSNQAGAIHRLIWQHFDPRAEHLPSLEEVAAAIEAKSILIAESEGAIAALLFHATTRVTTTLRYWLVLPEFRGKGFGQLLLDRYLADCVQCRRFLLWVQRDNHRAIAHYERAGYRPDGLLDQILRKPV